MIAIKYKLSAFLILLLSAPLIATAHPDGCLRTVEIGGDTIDGALFVPGAHVAGVKIRVYSGDKIIWQGTSDKQGRFEVYGLSQGTYQLVVEKWGRAIVRIISDRDSILGGQRAHWFITLGAHACVDPPRRRRAAHSWLLSFRGQFRTSFMRLSPIVVFPRQLIFFKNESIEKLWP
jgi:hypothetical protein